MSRTRHERYVELRKKALYGSLTEKEAKRFMSMRDKRFKRMLACNPHLCKFLLLQLAVGQDDIAKKMLLIQLNNYLL